MSTSSLEKEAIIHWLRTSYLFFSHTLTAQPRGNKRKVLQRLNEGKPQREEVAESHKLMNNSSDE